MISEYEYLEYVILERWWAEVVQRVHPLQDSARSSR